MLSHQQRQQQQQEEPVERSADEEDVDMSPPTTATTTTPAVAAAVGMGGSGRGGINTGSGGDNSGGARVRNRRYRRLQQLAEGGVWFSDEAMKERDPWLWFEYVGKRAGEEKPAPKRAVEEVGGGCCCLPRRKKSYSAVAFVPQVAGWALLGDRRWCMGVACAFWWCLRFGRRFRAVLPRKEVTNQHLLAVLKHRVHELMRSGRGNDA